jgi:D-beta-D-heptose 7-phosphate kinase/D-beta-D-heptose 1-phosphate adenosyltransferase
MKSADKITTLNSLVRKVAALKKKKRTIAFTNGCFDILHLGHVSYLEKAKKNDRILIVGMNSDASTRRLKGKGRPFNGEKSRAAVLAALACVDFVVVFDSDTPYELIAKIKPDVLIKGADYKNKGVVGSDIVEANGGHVELITFIKRYSTTKVLKSAGIRAKKNSKGC